MQENQDSFIAAEVIALERAALDRWYNGDPGKYRELMAPSVTYFDPWIPARLDGLQAIEDYIKPLVGQVFADRYEMLNPKVQVHGETAILTFNLVTYNQLEDGTEKVLDKWNAAEVYTRIEGSWKTVHVNWSYTDKDSESAE
jgi:ketosteroid isomerase-like protein